MWKAAFARLVGLILGVPCEVEPCAALMLAILRGLEQSVDQLRVSIRTAVRNKSLDLVQCGRQTCQVQRDAANQGPLVGSSDRGQPRRVELGDHESVNRLREALVFGDGCFFRHHGLERPELGGRFPVDLPNSCCRAGSGIGRTHPDPLHQIIDSSLGQHRIWGHLRRSAWLASDQKDQQALVRLARNDGGSGIAALFPASFGVESKSALLLLLAVASETMFDQHRADLGLEEVMTIVGVRSGRRSDADKCK